MSFLATAIGVDNTYDTPYKIWLRLERLKFPNFLKRGVL